MGNFFRRLFNRSPVKDGYYTSLKTREEVYYQSTGVLGKGTFGVVYSAVDDYGQQIAVKSKKVFENRNTMSTSDMLFRGELESLFNLDHPNLVKLLGVEFNSGDAYGLVMEFVVGDTLTSIIKTNARLPEYLIKLYTQQLVSGIAYMHSRNVIHRDIKSSNVMIIGYTYVKIIDFGLAKKVQYAYGLNADSSSTAVGTLPYMAPELINFDNYDARIDVWSLGVVVYEMANGDPFVNVNNQQVILSQLPSNVAVATLSYVANDFIHTSLTKNFYTRPTAAGLAMHPFMY